MADFEKKPSATIGSNQGAPFVDGSSMSESHNNDVEKGTTEQLQRRLQSRHLQMIAIGGTIGTGLVRTTRSSSLLLAMPLCPDTSLTFRSSLVLVVLLQQLVQPAHLSHMRSLVPLCTQSW